MHILRNILAAQMHVLRSSIFKFIPPTFSSRFHSAAADSFFLH